MSVGPRWPLPIVLVLIVAIIMLVAVMAMLIAGRQGIGPAATLQKTGSTVTSSTSSFIPAVAGESPALVPYSQEWPVISAPEHKMTVRYPVGWKAINRSEAQSLSVQIYEPGVDPDLPSPVVAISWSSSKYGTFTPGSYHTLPVAITLAGITGRRYEDAGLAIPHHSVFIDLPYRDGTLNIVATKGPYVNLVPELEEILKGLVLQP